MNAPAPLNSPDPSTPGARPSPTAFSQAVTSVVFGAPLAVTTVWMLETWGTAHGQPLKLDSTTATSVGAVGAVAIGYLAQCVMGLWGVMIERLTRPK